MVEPIEISSAPLSEPLKTLSPTRGLSARPISFRPCLPHVAPILAAFGQGQGQGEPPGEAVVAAGCWGRGRSRPPSFKAKWGGLNRCKPTDLTDHTAATSHCPVHYLWDRRALPHPQFVLYIQVSPFTVVLSLRN